MWLLGRVLPLIIGDYVPDDDEHALVIASADDGNSRFVVFSKVITRSCCVLIYSNK